MAAFDALTQARQYYLDALKFGQLADVLSRTRAGMALLGGIESHDADALRLALLDLELLMQFSASYLPPPAEAVERFSALAARADMPIYNARALHYEGMMTWSTQNFEQGTAKVRMAMDMALACGDLEGQCHIVSTLGLFTSVTGQLERGVALMRGGLALHDQIETERRDLPMIQLNRARLMLRLALNLFDLDYFDEALHWLGEARGIYERLGRLFGCTTEYAQLYARVGYWAEAEHWAMEGMRHGAAESDRAYAQTMYGFILGQQGHIAEAIQQLEQSLETVTRVGLEKWQCALANVYLGDLLLADGPSHDAARSDVYNDAGYAIGEAAAVHYGTIYALINKARIALAKGSLEQAAAYAVAAADRVRTRDTLTLVREEEVLYWEYRALDAAGRDGLPSLTEAHRRLQVAAERISDGAMRQSFLGVVPIHRQIIEAYRAWQTA